MRKHGLDVMRWFVVCTVLLALGAGPAAGAVATPGDANGDGVVNLFDLVIVSRAYNPGAPATDPRADVNGDGTVDIFDLVCVALRLAAVPPATPPTSAQFPENVYALQSERIVAGYAVRLWDSASALPFRHAIATIDRVGQPRLQVEDIHELDPLTGSDVTGEGNPDVVLHRFTQGAHCCFSTVIYDLGPVASKVLETPLSNCSAELANLDGDAALEVNTCDDSFAYQFCPYAASPLVRVVMDYKAGQGYVPDSPRFAHLYAADTTAHTLRAEQTAATEGCDEAGVTKCAVLAVVLDHLYSGNPALAWSELYRLDPCAAAAQIAAEIVAIVQSSPLFAP